MKIINSTKMKALEIIKEKRKEKNISQDTIAKQLKIARSTYQALESGQNKMNIIVFFKIIEILDIPITLFAEEEIIIIEKKDFNEITKYTNRLNKLVNKIAIENKGNKIKCHH